MRYKALFLDVDGTTVARGYDNLPSARVTTAIARCASAGIPVSLATSRPLSAVKSVIDHLQLQGYCVISSGSQIYDPVKKKIISEKKFPKDAILQIIEVAKEYNEEVRIFDGVREAYIAEGKLPNKVVGMWFPKLMPHILSKIHARLRVVEGISLHRMDAWEEGFECIDITSSEASKLHGVVEVARRLGIKTQEMIGVGDGYNDFPLLMACGLKIAMGNAVPELKAIADFIAPTVYEDGVATVIEKFILN